MMYADAEMQTALLCKRPTCAIHCGVLQSWAFCSVHLRTSEYAYQVMRQ